MVLAHYGLRMLRGHQLCCPFHDDKTPSMRIYLKTNTFCCFSSNCSAGTGDVIDFIQLKEKCSKHEAIVKAKTLIGATEKTVNQFSRQAMMMRFWESCREGIKRSPKAQEYLSSRGLADNAAGYCGEKSMKHWALPLRKAAAKYGLQQKGTPHFQQCVIFPLLDTAGKPASFYGRAVGEKKHVYLPGGHCGLYPAYPKGTTTTVILTESIIDAASLQPHTDHAVLALYGTNGITAEHWQALGNLEGLKEIILFLDGDEAGKSATMQLAEKLHSRMEKLIISHIETPEGEDVNSLLVSHSEEAKGLFEHLLKERKTLKAPKATSVEMAKIIALEKAATTENPEKITTKPTAKTATISTKNTGNFNSSNPLNLLYDTTELLLSVKGGLRLDNDWQAMSALKVSLHIENKNTGRKYRSKIDLYEG
ncbi:toprim domain-containing protein, partial [Flexithrix dorotheae]|uniref:toprim domain-containing protein n=1 Tax=Flexithrix dorotheae TaxID=70993 RepID=UPI001FDEC9DB